MKPRLALFVFLGILPLSAQTHILRPIDVPKYPALAYQARIQGTVGIRVNSSAEGLVTQATVLYGTPLLRGLALENVKTWRF
jgi:outer membrane biosynthesis protein TonB